MANRFDVRLEPNDEGTSTVDVSSGQGTDVSIRRYNITVLLPGFETEETVKIFSGIPMLGQPLAGSPNKLCTSVHITRKSPVFFSAELEFSLPTSSGNQGGKKPTDQMPEISRSFAITEEDQDQDADGGALMTVVGEPYDPPFRWQVGDLVITVARNVPYWSDAAARQYLFKTNSDGIPSLGIPPGQALVTHLEADQIFNPDGKGWYFRRKSAIQWREQGRMSSPDRAWWIRRRAEGFLANVTRDEDGILVPSNQVGVFIGTHTKLENLAQTINATKPVLHDKKTGNIFTKKKTVGTGYEVDYSPKNAQWYEWKKFKSVAFSGGPLL